MAQQALPTLNGITPSWADIQTTFSVPGGESLETADYAAINHSSTVEIGEKRGASGGQVTATTVGQSAHEATVTFYKEGLLRFFAILAALAPTRADEKLISLVHFDILIQHTPLGSADIHKTELRGCRVLTDDEQSGEGVDAAQVEVQLHVKQRRRYINGQAVTLL